MKRISILFFLAATVFLAACGGSPENSAKTGDAEDVADNKSETTYVVDAANSTINWEGKKVAYSHTGTINLKSGMLETTGGKVTGGTFVVDMGSIQNSDIEDEEEAGQLVGHLTSPDFFDVENHPDAKFEITKVENGEVSGNLTIKGVTKNISFPAEINTTETDMSATADFSINRTDWGVQYGSGNFFDLAADKVIDDNISFKVNLKGAPKAS